MAAKQPPFPTIGKRQLARELRRRREVARLTLDQVATRLDWAKTKVHNYENGRWTRGNLTDLRALLDLYEVTDQRLRESLETLMREAKKKGWWVQYGDAFDGALPAFEDEASQISTYEPEFIPGLLQTREYTTAVLSRYPFIPAADVKQKIEARIQRQQILTRGSPLTSVFVIEEAAIQRLIGSPDVFKTQLEHLIGVAEDTDNTASIQIMPLRSGLHAGMGGSFVILDFADDYDLTIVCTEAASRNAYLESKEEVALHRTRFTYACGAALSQEQSIQLFKSLLKQHA
ncbi:helix-turn-helix domain-containing protein [Nocardiopsis ansamitocini]|uniref:Transcriptional regulator n=1 Tax=Nocardiopsis ansamitocini TaxID=1670832 RepID=A0A9W6PBA9_9ACTN|nr:helix-turn-helix transcriptional regulator [Nocardiopsis ansamitocini]GLU50516.1 transcriptional regulator [Nocardiopsis ansamitocini]